MILSTTIPSKEDPFVTIMDIEKGLNFILSHFDPDILPFERNIMTLKIGKQKEVYSKDEALRHFIASSHKDLRINAYRPYRDPYTEINKTPISFIMIDLDLKDFNYSNEKLDKFKNKTLKKIKKLIGGYPSVSDTGGGYHIYQPINGSILDSDDTNNFFSQFISKEKGQDLTSKFLKFAESFFTDGKSDPSHSPSINSCLVRIPYSINSKYNTQVKIIQEWNGYRPPIDNLLKDFKHYLIQDKINKKYEIEKMRNKRGYQDYKLQSKYTEKKTIEWIEKLLQTPIEDYRKNAVSLILAPYLINIKKLSYHQSFQIINEWLSKCNDLQQLDERFDERIKQSLKTAIEKKIPPMKLVTLKERNLELFIELSKNLTI
ncbi:MAG: DNA primase noncatalytic subunit PriX [Nitrososphaeraceae archaeon]